MGHALDSLLENLNTGWLILVEDSGECGLFS